MLLGELADEFAGHHKRLFVGQANLLAGLDGCDGGLQACKTNHCGEHHVDGFGLHNLLEGFLSGVDFDVGAVGQQLTKRGVMGLVGNDHGRRIELAGLSGEFFHPVVGCQGIHFVEVAVLFDNVKCLCADRAGRAQNAYLLFHNLS